jgi:hypothetical protein
MSDLLGHLDGFLDIAFLRRLFATAEQNDEDLAALDKINAVARAIVDPKLANAVEKFDIAMKASLKTHNALSDALSGTDIGQPFKPSFEFDSLTHFDHM